MDGRRRASLERWTWLTCESCLWRRCRTWGNYGRIWKRQRDGWILHEGNCWNVIQFDRASRWWRDVASHFYVVPGVFWQADDESAYPVAGDRKTIVKTHKMESTVKIISVQMEYRCGANASNETLVAFRENVSKDFQKEMRMTSRSDVMLSSERGEREASESFNLARLSYLLGLQSLVHDILIGCGGDGVFWAENCDEMGCLFLGYKDVLLNKKETSVSRTALVSYSVCEVLLQSLVC